MCSLASELNECTCGPFCCDRPFVMAMRTKVRTMYGIRVSEQQPPDLNDCHVIATPQAVGNK